MARVFGGSFKTLTHLAHANIRIGVKTDKQIAISADQPIKLNSSGCELQILSKKGLFIAGNHVSISGMTFSGNMSFVNIDGKCTINGIPAEEYKKTTKVQEVDDSEYCKEWILEANIFDDVNVESSGNLQIDSNCLAFNSQIALSGSGDASVSTKKFQTLALISSGSGDFTGGYLTTETINLAMSGSGNCCIKGMEASNLILKSTGSGDCSLGQTPSTEYHVQKLDKVAFCATHFATKQDATPMLRKYCGDWRLTDTTSVIDLKWRVFRSTSYVLADEPMLSSKEKVQILDKTYAAILELQQS